MSIVKSFLRFSASALVAAALAGCSNNLPERLPAQSQGALASAPTSGFPARDVFDMLDLGLTYVDRLHVREVPLGRVVAAGLNEVASLDPRFSVRPSQTGIAASFGGAGQNFPVRNPQDPASWAQTSFEVLSTMRSQSQQIASLDTKELYEELFEGITDELDEFSRYLAPTEVKRQDDRFLGFGGLGITISNEPGGVRVSNILRRSPAERAGLKKGDLIVAVDGRPFGVDEKTSDRLKKLKGPVGSRANISVLRNGQLQSLSVRREEVVGESVELEMRGSVAHVQIFTFNSNTAPRVEDSIREASTKARASGSPLTGVILDVRDNGGGLRAAVVDVADIFLDQTVITRTRGRMLRANKDFETRRPDVSNGLPIIVLINEGSASASELLAAAIQDNNRGIVIGSTSFGKGSVQSKLPLPNQGELALTTAEFFGPSNLPLHTYGVVPSICTSDNTLAADALLTNIVSGRKSIPAAQARRAFAGNPNFGIDSYRRLCPPSESAPERDLNVADRVFSDQRIYQFMLNRLVQGG